MPHSGRIVVEPEVDRWIFPINREAVFERDAGEPEKR
jgi:hypothetical protein